MSHRRSASTPREPKKYIDARRTQATPEWLAWDDERRANVAEDCWKELLGGGYDPVTYLPEIDDKKIPEDGAWILILEEPLTGLRDRFRVPLLSMWRARRHELNSSSVTTSTGVKLYPQQAVITTPGGDLHLWPHEYTIAKNPMALASDPDSTLNTLGGEAVLDEEKMFYLQSRGIPRQEATLMLFDTIVSLDFVYVTFPEYITAALEGVGRPLRRHIALSKRAPDPA